MINELQKRPFTRPLLVWIIGIYLYVFFPVEQVSSLLLFLLLGMLVFSRVGNHPHYNSRWHWGMSFSILLFVTSILVSAMRDICQDGNPLLPFLTDFATDARTDLLTRLERLQLSKTSRDVLGTMLLGNATVIEREVRVQFSVTGVAHILSVSGFHVAVVCGFISILLKALPSGSLFRWTKYIIMMLLLWSFTLISGLAPPSVRAAMMLSFFLTGQMINRSTDGYNTLAASAFIMLVYNPFYLFDIGFQLSYIAVWFILLLQPPLERLLEIRNPLLSKPYAWITVSLAAQAGTAFLCLYYFSQFPTLFLLTNLPFSLVSLFLIPSGLVYMLLPEGFPGIVFLERAIEWMTNLLMYIVESFSIFPWAAFVIPFDFFDLILGYLFLFLLIFFIYRKRPAFLLLSLSFLALLLIKLLIETLWFSAT
ncbi:ComEC/Rec2 family competence protein [Massilibacteroides sp.]|uniref:ComEC/Rec2 family competence protein n=1 Tax=Massilibacteroides sp. TaxID=2034766 RepID=UPI00262DC0A6|nr:ComEC/Rec2 family competence protein [Massilibacteroides sp.]MDD4514357.1 ComEC/Rec2 family competence protein [Massilibacteroides sp.]